MNIWAGRWSEMHRWWSVRLGAFWILVVAGLPPLADQWPTLQPIISGWLPEGKQAWVVIVGVVVSIAARMVSQAAVMALLGRLFGKKGADDGQN
jgi:hypothetical protein